MSRAILRKSQPVMMQLIEIGRCYKGSPMGTSTKGGYKGGDDYASPQIRFEPADFFKHEPSSDGKHKDLFDELKAAWAGLMQAGRIQIRFPYSSVEDNFTYTNRVTKAIGSTTRTFRECDGSTCTKWVETINHPSIKGKTIPAFRRGAKPCSAIEGKECPEGCEAKGMLKFIVPDLYPGGVILFPLGSPIDINAMRGYLEPWRNLDLQAVPFSLFRMEKQVDYEVKGEMQTKKNWGLHLQIDPVVSRLMLQGTETRYKAQLEQGYTTPLALQAAPTLALPQAKEDRPLRMMADSEDGFNFVMMVQQAIRDRDPELLESAAENASDLVLGGLYHKASLNWIESEVSRARDAIGTVYTTVQHDLQVQQDSAKPKPKKQATVNDQTAVALLLQKFESSVQNAKTIEQLNELQKWIRLPKQWAVANTIPDIESTVMKLTGDRILELGAASVSPPSLDEEEGKEDAIDAEVLTEQEADRQPANEF